MIHCRAVLISLHPNNDIADSTQLFSEVRNSDLFRPSSVICTQMQTRSFGGSRQQFSILNHYIQFLCTILRKQPESYELRSVTQLLRVITDTVVAREYRWKNVQALRSVINTGYTEDWRVRSNVRFRSIWQIVRSS
jgi:hypothetical protein